MKAEGLLALSREILRAAGEAEAELYLRVAERGCARFAIGELGQHMQLAEPQAVVAPAAIEAEPILPSNWTRLPAEAREAVERLTDHLVRLERQDHRRAHEATPPRQHRQR